MITLNINNRIVNFNGVNYTPTNLLSNYIESVDSTGCFIELDENQYRIFYSETILNDNQYNTFEEFSNIYLSLINN
jgi:hypothetical protein